jgi:hypothetical protein
MNFVYYILGSFIYLVLTVLYNVIQIGRFELTQPVLFELAIRSAMAGLAFLAADYLMKKK